jgi:hypothetical protein
MLGHRENGASQNFSILSGLRQCFRLHQRFLVGDGGCVQGGCWQTQGDRLLLSGVSVRVLCPCLVSAMKLARVSSRPSLGAAWVRTLARVKQSSEMGGRAFRRRHSLPVRNVVQSAEYSVAFYPELQMPRLQYLWQENAWASLR